MNDDVNQRFRSHVHRDAHGGAWLHRQGVGYLVAVDADVDDGLLAVRIHVMKPADQLPDVDITVGGQCAANDPPAAAVWYAREHGLPVAWATRQRIEPTPADDAAPVCELIEVRPLKPPSAIDPIAWLMGEVRWINGDGPDT